MYTQISFTTEKVFVEERTNLLENLGSVSVTYLDAKDEPILEPSPNEVKLWSQVIINALFDDSIDVNKLKTKLNSILKEKEVESLLIEKLEDKNWVEEWKENFKPIHIANNFWIYPNWIDEDTNSDKVILKLDPGLAFGTGTHETTFLCLKWLAENSEIIKNKQLVDYGCGSGILGIGAAILGAKHIWGIDYDKQAVISSKNNSKNNSICDKTFEITVPEELPIIKADVIIANILVEPLIKLSVKFNELLKTDGYLVLSGILKEQVQSIKDAYNKDFSFVEIEEKGDWVRLVFIKD